MALFFGSPPLRGAFSLGRGIGTRVVLLLRHFQKLGGCLVGFWGQLVASRPFLGPYGWVFSGSLGPSGGILWFLGVVWGTFCGSLGSSGGHFWGPWGRLGGIFWVLGVVWVAFFRSLGSSGGHFVERDIFLELWPRKAQPPRRDYGD